jgi:valine dehydrogenase (NAD+)
MNVLRPSTVTEAPTGPAGATGTAGPSVTTGSAGPSVTTGPAVTTGSAGPSGHRIDQEIDHEAVMMWQDRATGLRAVIAVHSTALGPALGGVRFHPYGTVEEAMADALRLSRGMTYKNALAGIDYGGGKAVIIGDPERDRTEELLLAYGRAVAALGGRYITAPDAGTAAADMDVVARACPHTVGRSEAAGGIGDASAMTAYGVLQSMRAAAGHAWGRPSLRGRVVGVTGVGKVGGRLVGRLVEEGAEVVVTDVRAEAVEQVLLRHPGVRAAETERELLSTPGLDVYAPCALGGALDDAAVGSLTARIVCGAANNQLARPGIDGELARRGILYVPDYLANAGGVIQVVGELHDVGGTWCQDKAAGIFDLTRAILRQAEDAGITPAAAADRLAERRINAARN